jgi:maltooligosyltrehalose synthase
MIIPGNANIPSSNSFSLPLGGKLNDRLLALIYRALKAKKAHREIFRAGAYLPLESAGRFRSHVIAFAWRY